MKFQLSAMIALFAPAMAQSLFNSDKDKILSSNDIIHDNFVRSMDHLYMDYFESEYFYPK